MPWRDAAECPICLEPTTFTIDCKRGHGVCCACARQMLLLTKHSNENDYSTRLGMRCPLCRNLFYVIGPVLAQMLNVSRLWLNVERLQRFCDGEIDGESIGADGADRADREPRPPPTRDPVDPLRCAGCKAQLPLEIDPLTPVRCGEACFVCRRCEARTCFDCTEASVRVVGISRRGCSGFRRRCAGCGARASLGNLDLLCLLQRSRREAVGMFANIGDMLAWNACAKDAPSPCAPHLRVGHPLDSEFWVASDEEDP